jgi:hypothetical protein
VRPELYQLAMARLLREHGLLPAEFHVVVQTAAGRFELDAAFSVNPRSEWVAERLPAALVSAVA